MIYVLENSSIRAEFDSLGAELKVLYDKKNERNLLWNGNPDFWKRSSPVLFPLVGSLKDGSYSYEGRSYKMSQHGFARDMEFSLYEKSEDGLVFVLEDNEDSYSIYPFHFRLTISYKLNGSSLVIGWMVENKNDKDMYFSIGAHPAFMCPVADGEERYLQFDRVDPLTVSVLGHDGLLTNERRTCETENGYLRINEALFDDDALIIEHNQAHEVSLCDSRKKPYITVRFAAPLFGIWSPPKKKAPFVCIEPWYGRCDRACYDKSLKEREWGNRLEPGEHFHAEYSITVE